MIKIIPNQMQKKILREKFIVKNVNSQKKERAQITICLKELEKEQTRP